MLMSTMHKILSKKDIDRKLVTLSGWALNKKGTEIRKEFLFSTYIVALSFVAKVAVHAEVIGHHPEMTLSYGKVGIVLTTKDVKGLTKQDFALATRIDGLQA